MGEKSWSLGTFLSAHVTPVVRQGNSGEFTTLKGKTCKCRYGWMDGLSSDKEININNYMVKSHEMDSLWGPVRNSEGYIITLFEKYL